MIHRSTSLCLLALLSSLPVTAQTLAHPGWRGNGISAQAWWKHASFLRLGTDTTFADAAHMLDVMAEAGVDSMILPDLQPAIGAPLPFSDRFGTQDDLDALLREASARRVHVLVTMPLARLSAGDAEVRFWLSRGIAGFRVDNVSAGDLSVLRGVRSAMARFPGERILMAHTAPDAAARQADRDPVTLHLLSADEAAAANASAKTLAIDITDASGLERWNRGVVPIFGESLLTQDEGGTRIRTALTQRAGTATRTAHAGRRP